MSGLSITKNGINVKLNREYALVCSEDNSITFRATARDLPVESLSRLVKDFIASDTMRETALSTMLEALERAMVAESIFAAMSVD